MKNVPKWFPTGIAILTLALVYAYLGRAQHSATHVAHAVVPPQTLQWQALPLPGAQMAVVNGDPGKPGEPFVIRIKFADRLKVPPHWHPTDEHITILQGVLSLGLGEKFDAAKLHDLTPGTYAFMPKEVRHFAYCKGEVIAQVHGIGPFQINWVNPADVPSETTAPQKK